MSTIVKELDMKVSDSSRVKGSENRKILKYFLKTIYLRLATMNDIK